MPTSSQAPIPLKLPLSEVLHFGKIIKRKGVMPAREEITFEFHQGELTISTGIGGTRVAYQGSFQGTLRMTTATFIRFIISYRHTDKNRPWIFAELDISAGFLRLEHTRCRVKIAG